MPFSYAFYYKMWSAFIIINVIYSWFGVFLRGQKQRQKSGFPMSSMSGKLMFSEVTPLFSRPCYRNAYHKNYITNLSECAKGLSIYGKGLDKLCLSKSRRTVDIPEFKAPISSMFSHHSFCKTVLPCIFPWQLGLGSEIAYHRIIES